MADVIFVLHRAITVSPPEPAPEATPRHPNPYRDYAHKDSGAEFVVRDADEVEARAE
jgi:hypothetical protein